MASNNQAQKATLMVTRLDQARLLADPIKLRIIQELALEPHTTKQVADALGEKPTKLYRHVEALDEAELITLVETKPKRGTLEKYYLAVARRFEIDPALFAPDSPASDDLWDALLNDTTKGIRRALQDMHENPPHEDDLQPSVQKFGIRGTESQIKQLQEKFQEWLAQCEQEQEQLDEPQLHWSGFVAFYPEPED